MLILSDFLQHHAILFFWWLFGFVVLIWLFFKTHIWMIVKSYLLLKLPVIKDLYKKAQLIYFLENFYVMMKWWLWITEILDYLINSVDNYFFKKELILVKMLVLTWDPISKAMWITEDIVSFKSVLLPVEVAYWIKIWEDTWKLTEVLWNMLENYKKDFKIYLDNFSQILEPILMLVIWWLIFVLVMAIFLPMMGIYQEISKQVKF
jgi:type II secretory pathway component PulF